MKHKPFRYLVECQYLGFRFHGWQKQPEVITVQGHIEKTLNFVFEEKVKFKTMGAGRTDAMVSVESSWFELFLEEEIHDLSLFLEKTNQNLPMDIRFLSIKKREGGEDLIQASKEKEYWYFFSFGQKNHPFCSPFLVNILEDLDVDLMQRGAKIFEGEHDFKRFIKNANVDSLHVREVNFSTIEKNTLIEANFFPKESYVYRVRGPGFGRYQIRFMMGALFAIGKRELTLEELEQALSSSENRAPLTKKAPASGLVLGSNTLFGL
jgi:tRNA pseudouridine38-40 synthase